MAVRVTSSFRLATILSTSITSVLSVVYIILSIIGLVIHFDCENNYNTIDNHKYFWTTVYRTYILSDDCAWSIRYPQITRSHTVMVLLATILALSTLNLISSIMLTVVTSRPNVTQYLNAYVYAYVGCWAASLVVDVTLGTHFGMDITLLTKDLSELTLYVPMLEVLRQGAFYLMAISLKGFAIYAFQIILICLIIINLHEHQGTSSEHSMHKDGEGPISAFEQLRPNDDMNGRLPREDSRGPGFRRSESWNHRRQHNPSSQVPSSNSLHPFSYLEDRPPSTSTSAQGPWTTPSHRMPIPDYSPPNAPRKLKPALKHY